MPQQHDDDKKEKKEKDGAAEGVSDEGQASPTTDEAEETPQERVEAMPDPATAANDPPARPLPVSIWRVKPVVRDADGRGHVAGASGFIPLSEFKRQRAEEKRRLQEEARESQAGRSAGQQGRARVPSAPGSLENRELARAAALRDRNLSGQEDDDDDDSRTPEDEDYDDTFGGEEEEAPPPVKRTRELIAVVNGQLVCRHGTLITAMRGGGHRALPSAFWAYLAEEEVESVTLRELRTRKYRQPACPPPDRKSVV